MRGGETIDRSRQTATGGLLLFVVLLVAAALRFYALGNGLPHVVGPDEGFEIHRALKLGAGEIDLERTAKGGFFYLLFVEYGFYFAWLRLTGSIAGAQEFADRFALDITPFWMIARVTHVVVSLLAVLAVYELGRRAYSRRAGLLAAALTGCSALVVGRSQFVGVDLPMTLLVLLALIVALDWADPGRRARPIVLGVLLGAATMTKLPAVLLVAPIATANLLRHRGEGWRRRLLSRGAIIAYVVGLVVFAVGNPGFTLGLPAFFDKFSGVLLGGASTAEEVYLEAGRGTNLWLFYAGALRSALGWPAFFVGLFGLAFALVRRRPADLLLLAFALPFYGLIAGAQTSHLFYPRYVIPLVPLLALLAARVVDRAFDGAAEGSVGAGAGRRLALLAAVVVLLAAPLLASLDWARGRGREDSRIYARRWMEEHLPEGSSVFLLGNPVVDTAPNLSLPLRASADNLDRLSRELRAEGSPAKAQVLQLRKKSGGGRAFDLHTVQHFEKVAPLSTWRSAGVEYYALLDEDFSPDAVARDAKHPGKVLASRLRLYDELTGSPSTERVFAIDPESAGLQGPAIEVFRHPPLEASGSIEAPDAD